MEVTPNYLQPLPNSTDATLAVNTNLQPTLQPSLEQSNVQSPQRQGIPNYNAYYAQSTYPQAYPQNYQMPTNYPYPYPQIPNGASSMPGTNAYPYPYMTPNPYNPYPMQKAYSSPSSAQPNYLPSLATDTTQSSLLPMSDVLLTKDKSTEKQNDGSGQKRDRVDDKTGDDEYVPKRKRYGEEERNEIIQEQVEEEPQEPEEEVEVEVIWPEDALIIKEQPVVVTEAQQQQPQGEGQVEGQTQEGKVEEQVEGQVEGQTQEGKVGGEAQVGDQQPAPVIPESNEKQYERVIVAGNTYSVGDTIALWPEGKAPAPMGTIKALFTDGETNNVEICWFYRLEETFLKAHSNRRGKVGPREVFLSSHADENAVESIQKKVSVKPLKDIEHDKFEDYIKQPDNYFYKKKYNHLDKCFEDL